MKKPIVDVHCDLLSYLNRPQADINTTALGCSIPYLKEGNVKLQVMAIFAPTQAGSHQLGMAQSQLFDELNTQESRLYALEKQHLETLSNNERIGMLASIENASAFCDENITLKEGFSNLQRIVERVGRLFYIGFTHHSENRFGGGNYSSIGLKNDGKALMDYLDKKNIAIDFSHTSDALAYDMLNYISKQRLAIPIIASHSNYRSTFDHPRNLPDDIALEIIRRQGLIGLNFLRAFVNNEKPEALQEHISHGMALGAQNAMCFGADYFYHKNHPDKSRIPFFFKAYENASCYPQINEVLQTTYNDEICNKISYKNATDFLTRLWS
jgi:membrane dipeptidase